MATNHEITNLLKAWSAGDPEALSQLIPLVDVELRKIAHAFMNNERPGHTLQTTALIHEALIRLISAEKINWNSRKHFFALIAIRMRQILIEHARKQMTQKRGDRAETVNISDAGPLSFEASQELILLDEALTKLGQFDERKAKVVELRHFGGFTIDEIADLLDIAPATVEREWRVARSWLKREITGETE